jgi:ribosomal protein S14
MADWRFNVRGKIYLRRIFDKFDKYSSVSFFKRSCLLTGHARSVFRRFKLVRHQAKFYGSHGFIVGLRKASF